MATPIRKVTKTNIFFKILLCCNKMNINAFAFKPTMHRIRSKFKLSFFKDMFSSHVLLSVPVGVASTTLPRTNASDAASTESERIRSRSRPTSALNEQDNRNEDSKLSTFEPNDSRLRSHECLKNAAGLTVDSTSAVLSQTVYALTRIEEQYVELVDVLVILMEYQLQVLGHVTEEERIGDLIVETRHEINKVKQRKQDLHLLFSSVEKLADASAEVAFAAGAEYASTSAGERLYSAQREVQRVTARSQEADRRLMEAQAKSVQVLAQHEEKQREAGEKSGAAQTASVVELGTEEVTAAPSVGAGEVITAGVGTEVRGEIAPQGVETEGKEAESQVADTTTYISEDSVEDCESLTEKFDTDEKDDDAEWIKD